MSRSNLPKSRTEKGGKATSATPAIAHEIIPGKYNDQDWFFMVDHDDGDEFITDIVEEVCSSAMDIIYESYIQRQLVPYTVCQAKDAILQIIEWQFLARDTGESNVETDVGWTEDEEPEPAVTDCWAQGSVPKIRATPREKTIVEDEEPEPLETTEQPLESELSPVKEHTQATEKSEEGGESIEESEEEEEEEEEEDEEEELPKEPTPQPSVKEEPLKKKSSYKRHGGRLRSAGVSKMTESLEDTELKIQQKESSASLSKTPDPEKLKMPSSCHSMLKLQAGRPPGNRDVLFDDKGNVISVYRLDPEKLPIHKVKTGFKIIDPEIEAAQARLEAMKMGRRVAVKHSIVPQPPATAKTSHTRNTAHTSRTYNVSSTQKHSHAGKEPKAYDVGPLPPPMIETVEVAPGVVIKEGDRIKMGPKQHGKKLEEMLGALQRGLRPVQMRADLPTISVAELLENHTPLVKPLVDHSPIPPISPQSQLSS